MDRRPEVRIGDRERREVDTRLRAAQDEGMLTLAEYDERSRACFAARFRAELDELVADLPDVASRSSAPTVHETVPDVRDDRPALSRRLKGWGGNLVALGIAGALVWSVLGAAQGAALLGQRTVTVAPGQTEVEVGVLFGSTTVVVPDGVRASTSGLTVFGSTRCAAACAAGTPGGPEVDVSARGAFGSVEVMTAAEAARGVDLNDLEPDD